MRDELIERHVGLERRVKPGGDLLATAVDIAGAFVVVAKEIVPKAEPINGVVAIICEQLPDKEFTFVSSLAGDKSFEDLRRGQETDYVEISAARKYAIIDR